MTLKEAWNGLLERIKKYAEIFEDKEEQKSILKELDIIRPHLVPPTAYENWLECEAELNRFPTVDEVYKELCEFTKHEVRYSLQTKQFYYRIENTECVMFITETYGDSLWSLGVYLPPHLITLIGRFYEGLEVEE